MELWSASRSNAGKVALENNIFISIFISTYKHSIKYYVNFLHPARKHYVTLNTSEPRMDIRLLDGWIFYRR